MTDYPFSTVIYSKDRYARQHRRCFFKSNSLRPTHDRVIDHVVWEHNGKVGGASFTATHYDPHSGGRTKFCLQDIIDICNYNGVQFSLIETGVFIEEIYPNIEIQATITERDDKMYIRWGYKPFMLRNSITPPIYMNETFTDEHQITVLDMEQIKRMFDFNKFKGLKV